MNLLVGPQAILKAPNLENMPETFVCISIPMKTLFLEEFMLNLLGQDYPKSKLIMYVTVKNQKQIELVKQHIPEAEFKYVNTKYLSRIWYDVA